MPSSKHPVDPALQGSRLQALKALLTQQPKPAWWERLPLLRRWVKQA